MKSDLVTSTNDIYPKVPSWCVYPCIPTKVNKEFHSLYTFPRGVAFIQECGMMGQTHSNMW